MSAPESADLRRCKERVRQEWADARTVAAWRKWDRLHQAATRGATDAIVEKAQVKPGMRVLDLATGSGEPALTLAEAAGTEGHVTATDLVPEMLAIAEENARRRGLNNISFQLADAEALPFPDHSFEVVTCRYGVMFFPDVGQALREIRRVLKPGGRAAFVANGPFEQNPYFTTTIGVFMKYVEMPPPEPGAPHPFKFASPGSLSSALKEARFQQVQEETRTIPWQLPGTVEQTWDFVRERGAPFRRLIESLAPERRDDVIKDVLAGIRQYYDGQQVNFPMVIVVASGVR